MFVMRTFCHIFFTELVTGVMFWICTYYLTVHWKMVAVRYFHVLQKFRYGMDYLGRQRALPLPAPR